jgi:hypothetical protein
MDVLNSADIMGSWFTPETHNTPKYVGASYKV